VNENDFYHQKIIQGIEFWWASGHDWRWALTWLDPSILLTCSYHLWSEYFLTRLEIFFDLEGKKLKIWDFLVEFFQTQTKDGWPSPTQAAKSWTDPGPSLVMISGWGTRIQIPAPPATFSCKSELYEICNIKIHSFPRDWTFY